MSRGLQISAVALLAGAMLAFGLGGLRAATSPTPDILSDDRTPDAVDVGRVKPLARPKVEPARVLPSGNPLWSVPLSALTATQARPIFSASRRPPQPAVVASAPELASAPPPAPADAEHPPLALIGAVVGAGEAIAVFLDRATQKVVRLRPGDSHGGWKLSGVESREVTFDKDNRSETLVLQRREEPAGAPGANAPAGESGVPAMPVSRALDGSGAPFVPRHTPKHGESDGL
jgi:general secretion pathway protein N